MQSSLSLMLLQRPQRPSLSFTSRMACARCSASSRAARSTWNAMRWALFCPMPGSRLNSVMRRESGSAKSGMDQNIPGGRPMPPSIPLIFCWISASTFLTASLQAATNMSWSISTSPATSGSILTASRFFWPSMFTLIMPPPAVASTRMVAISCCIFSCACCACRMICCMFPGSFTYLLLEVANLAHFSAEGVAEALDFRMAEGAAGGFVFLLHRRGGDWPVRRGGGGIAGAELDHQLAAEDFAHGLFEVLDRKSVV